MLIIYLTVLLLLYTEVQPLNILPARRTDDLTARRNSVKDILVNYLSNTRKSGINPSKRHETALAKAKVLLNKLTKNKVARKSKKKIKISDQNLAEKFEQPNIVELELKNTLTHKHSALLDKPYVQNKGRNDFLVIKPGVNDPFVTIIPNAIYYNIEKKCVNWLDDCSIRGIRERLLKGVNSPYK